MPNFKQDAPMDVYPVRMTAEHAVKARVLGDGNMSEGVRLAIAACTEVIKNEMRKGLLDRRKKKR